jgi:ATP-binding cassette subfamily B protein
MSNSGEMSHAPESPERAPIRDLNPIVTKGRFTGFWRLMEGYRAIYLIATVSLGIAALFRTGGFLWLARFIDEVLPNSPSRLDLGLAALGFVLIALVQSFFMFTSGALSSRTSEGIARDLRNYLYDHFQRLSFTYHDQTPTGDLIQRSTSDVDAIRRFFADQFIGAGRIIILFVVNFVAIAMINLQLAFISTLAVPVIVLISLFFFRKISQAYEAYQEQDAVLSTTLQENLSAVRVVKAFARQDFEINKFERDNWEKFSRGRYLLVMHSLFWPTSDLLSAFQMLAGLAIGAIMTINAELTTGEYVAFTGMLIWIIFPMRNLGRLIVQMSMGLVSFDRIRYIIREPQEAIDTGLSPTAKRVSGHIVFDRVGFSYADGSTVLKDINFTCQPGQAIALLGPTGSGKTSLVNLLPRFYEYTSGSLRLDGIELDQYSRSFLRSQIGIVEQEPFLFSRSIRENITLGVRRTVTQEEVEKAAKAAAIHDSICHFPDGYDTIVGERGVTLSGGQKQRVAIARTLLKDPSILILDDSTSSVDTLTEFEIRGALNVLMRGRSTFIIAHRIQSVMNADLIIVLDSGEIVQMGTHDELIQEEGIYQQTHLMQTQIEDALEKEIADA